MNVIGHGIDLVETARIKHLHEEHGKHFLDRVFTPAEQAYCSANPKRYFEHLAGRFAAKKALRKVLGTGWRGGISRNANGQPGILLSGECEKVAKSLGITQWQVSLSHIETHATASAIGLG
jgi:holo-[acyl-carrier protein] synthase